jgi:hypothetical protein
MEQQERDELLLPHGGHERGGSAVEEDAKPAEQLNAYRWW